MALPYLSLIVFLPLLGAVVIALLPREREGAVRITAAGFSLVALALSLVVFFAFDRSGVGVQFAERVRWIPQINVEYFLGVDGLSLPLLVLTTVLGFLAVLGSWGITLRVKEYFSLLLILETGVLGVFSALDFILFFLFWEVELVPMYLLIAIWGSPPPLGRREYSAIKFVIYTILGSAFMLVAILTLYFTTPTEMRSFDMTRLSMPDIPLLFQSLIFFAFFFAYAVKLPVFPLHTWLPDAHVDAPTAVSVMLAGVLLKMGGYAMLRVIVGMMPELVHRYAPLLGVLAVVNILYGALVTILQTDLKRMIAYSSVSHMGYVLLGIAALNQVSLTGAALQMFTHGTITGLLFLLVGLVYEKAHTRKIPELGGLAHRMPVIAVVFSVAGLAALGLPSMSGFVSELMVFLGGYSSTEFAQIQLYTVLGVTGILLTAGYMLWMLQRSFFGPLNPHHEGVGDASAIEAVPLYSLVALIMLIGLYPALLTDVIQAGVLPILGRLGSG